MAQEIVGVKIQVDGSEATQSVGSLKKQLREAQTEVANLSDKFGATSQQAIEAAKRAADLRDRIGDAKALTDAFNPDAKFKAFGQALTGVAGGFAAVQGAIGLFGDKSAEVEQTLLKVQSALAFSQGIEQLGGLKDSLTNVAAVVKSQVVGAFTTLRGALIATGIGAAAVAVGLLVANFDAVKKAVLNAIPGLGKAAEAIGKLVNKVTDFIGVTSEAERATAKLIRENDGVLKASERNLELNGDKYDEYTKRKIDANNKFREQQNKFLKDETLTEEQRNAFILQARERANREILQADKDRNNALARQRKEAYDKQLAIDTKRNEEELKRRKEDTDFEENNIKNRLKNYGTIAAVTTTVDEKVAERQKEFAKQNEDLANRNTEISTNAAQKQIQNIQELGKKNKEKYDNDIKLAQQKSDLEVQLASQTLAFVSSVIDQNSAAGKAVAVAQAIINTYQGASKAIAQGGIVGPIAAAATIAAGLVQVKKIISTKIPSASGTGSVSGGGQAPALAAAPIGIAAPQAQITQLNQQSINQLGSATSRAYVIESDVTSSQDRVARINRAARIG